MWISIKMIFENIKISENIKAKLVNVTKLLISLGIILFLLFEFDLEDIFQRIKNANLFLLLGALALLIPNIYIQFSKWQIILAEVISEKDKKKMWRSFMLGLGAGMITPWRSGEYIGRAVPFDSKQTLPILFSTFFDKGSTLFIVSFFGSIFSLYFLSNIYHVNNVVTVPLLILLVVLSLGFFYILTGSNVERKKLVLLFIPSQYKLKFQTKLNFLDSVSHKVSVNVFLLSGFQLLVVFTQFALLIFAFGGEGNLADIYLASLLVFFSKSFFPPVTVADIGVREAASIFFFGQFGVTHSAAFSAAIFLFVINLLLPSIYTLFITSKK